MMSPEFLKLSPLPADATISVGSDGPQALQKLLVTMGWNLLLSFTHEGGGEVQRWTSARGRRALDLHIPRHDAGELPLPTHAGVGRSRVALEFTKFMDELKLDAEHDPAAFAFFFRNRSMLDVVAFYHLDPEDRIAILN